MSAHFWSFCRSDEHNLDTKTRFNGLETLVDPLRCLLSSLSHYRAAKHQPVGLGERAWICYQISLGMAYLADHGVVHRDLATRNCMLAPPTDETFGMCLAVGGIEMRVVFGSKWRLCSVTLSMRARSRCLRISPLFIGQHSTVCLHNSSKCKRTLLQLSLYAGHPLVKVSDFGLAREVQTDNAYYKASGQDAMPVRWMAPESLARHRFTTQSDVWSFGITMWEVFADGQVPYKNMDLNVCVRVDSLFALSFASRMILGTFRCAERTGLILRILRHAHAHARMRTYASTY